MKLSICLLTKDENQYLDEWLDHHRRIGFDHFYIYDNHSAVPVSESISDKSDCSFILWDDNGSKTQVGAYDHCCFVHGSDDFIAFIDTDEFVMIDKQFTSVKEVLKDIRFERGNFAALGLYWRIYGKPSPYFTERQPVENYTRYSLNTHIKTIVIPRYLSRFLNPHHAVVHGKYIDENGREITGAQNGFHSSNLIWIKHTFTRSESEFREKVLRGSGDKVNLSWNMSHFRDFNDNCFLSD